VELLLVFSITVLLLVFVVPIRIGASGQFADEGAVRGRVEVLFGLTGVEVVYAGQLAWSLNIGPFQILRKTIGDKEEEVEAEPDVTIEDDSRPDSKSGSKSFWEKLDLAQTYYGLSKKPVLKLLRRLLKTVWFRKFDVDGSAGAGSPEATGRMLGVVYAVNGSLGKRVRLDVQPDFMASGFKGNVTFEIWFCLGYVIIAVVSAATGIGSRLGVWYLEDKVGSLWRSTRARFGRPKAQTV
jgi:hypothetical protein